MVNSIVTGVFPPVVGGCRFVFNGKRRYPSHQDLILEKSW
jgi:hypothetical protein